MEHKPNSIFESAKTILEKTIPSQADLDWANDIDRKINKISDKYHASFEKNKGLRELFLDIGEIQKDLGNASLRSYIESILLDKLSYYDGEKFYKALCADVNKAFGEKII